MSLVKCRRGVSFINGQAGAWFSPLSSVHQEKLDWIIQFRALNICQMGLLPAPHSLLADCQGGNMGGGGGSGKGVGAARLCP